MSVIDERHHFVWLPAIDNIYTGLHITIVRLIYRTTAIMGPSNRMLKTAKEFQKEKENEKSAKEHKKMFEEYIKEQELKQKMAKENAIEQERKEKITKEKMTKTAQLKAMMGGQQGDQIAELKAEMTAQMTAQITELRAQMTAQMTAQRAEDGFRIASLRAQIAQLVATVAELEAKLDVVEDNTFDNQAEITELKEELDDFKSGKHFDEGYSVYSASDDGTSVSRPSSPYRMKLRSGVLSNSDDDDMTIVSEERSKDSSEASSDSFISKNDDVIDLGL